MNRQARVIVIMENSEIVRGGKQNYPDIRFGLGSVLLVKANQKLIQFIERDWFLKKVCK